MELLRMGVCPSTLTGRLGNQHDSATDYTSAPKTDTFEEHTPLITPLSRFRELRD